MTVWHHDEPLVELPGSTPDDLPNVKDQDPPGCTRTRRSHSYNPISASSSTSTHVPYDRMNNSSQKELRIAQFSMSHKSTPESEGTQPEAANDQADRKSAHESSPLNDVVGRIIERTQSIASTTASIRMPVLVKRYRPQPVHVQKPHHRHHSLPTKLPPCAIQPSLEDDLRDWMIQTAASEYPPETNLTRSPTVSPTTGSIASRHEMMQILASIPNFEEDDLEANATAPVIQTNSLLHDDASGHPLPLSAPSSPPMALKPAHAQDSATLLSSFPMPPSRSGVFSAAHGLVMPQLKASSFALLQEEAVPAPPRICSLTAALRVTQSHGGRVSSSHPREDGALAVSLRLPPSQPDNPPIPSETAHQAHRAIMPQHDFVLPRKPLPITTKDNTMFTPLPANSPKTHNCVQLTEDGTTPKPPIEVQSVKEESESPMQPERPHSPPPFAMTSTFTLSGSEQGIPLKSSVDHATTDDASGHPRPPTTVPLFDASSQASRALEVHSTPPPAPAAPVTGAETNTEAPKPRTAEAKRRAAHARRMKLAFGE
jgi:hypothetical protein